MKLFGKIQVAAFGLLLVLACVASLTPMSALAQESQTSGCFTTSATQASRYTVPAGHRAWPGNGQSYGAGVRVWGSNIIVCPNGLTPTGASSSTTNSLAGQLCVDVSPLWDDVRVPDQGPEHKASDDANLQRLYLLTKHYRASGVWVMLKAAGYRWEGRSCLQQFQPVEDTFIGVDNEVHTVIVATRLWGTGTASYPTAMSTGEVVTVHAGGRLVKFDQNPAGKDDVVGRTCTDCSISNGPHSIWSSGGGNVWQLWPDNVICRTAVEVIVPAGQVPAGQSPDCH